jgi:hypothetical protein
MQGVERLGCDLLHMSESDVLVLAEQVFPKSGVLAQHFVDRLCVAIFFAFIEINKGDGFRFERPALDLLYTGVMD